MSTFANQCYTTDEAENKDVDDLIKLISQRGKQTSKLYRKWGEFHQQLDRNHSEMKEAVEQRKQCLIKQIHSQAAEEQQRLNRVFKSPTTMATRNEQILSQRLQELDVLLSKKDAFARNIRKHKKQLAQICKDDAEKVSTITDWQPVKLDLPEATSFDEMFGTISGGPTRTQAWSEDELETANESVDGLMDPNDERDEKLRLLSKPELQHSFSVKTSKDSGLVGVSDLAVNDNGEIIVVDKHNKLVKVYSHLGQFQRFIGRHQIKEPSRVSVLKNTTLVTDNHTKTIKLFQEKGQLLGTFVDDVKYPSSHCLSPDGRSIAVVEFSSGTVIIYDLDGQQQMSFNSGLESATYICSMRHNGQGR